MNLRILAHTDLCLVKNYVAYVYWPAMPASRPRGRCRKPVCCVGQGLVRSGVLSGAPAFGSGGAATETTV